MAEKILSLSDVLVGFIYSPQVSLRFPDIDLIFGCGDLPNYYLEFTISLLDAPLYYVNGNHQSQIESVPNKHQSGPLGGMNIHRKVVFDRGLLIGGVEGCQRYSNGPYQYTQTEMWGHVFSLIPKLFINRLIFGRYLDVFISHAPPWGIHDQKDFTHQGIKAFRWLLDIFCPEYHFHGHIHVYRPDTVVKTKYKKTCVINTYGFTETEIEPASVNSTPLSFLRNISKSFTGRST